MSSWPRSLTARILMVEAMAILVVVVLLPAVTVSLLHRTMRSYEAHSLEAQARQIAAALRWEDGSVRVHLPGALATAYATAYDGRSFALLDGRGRVLARSEAARDLPGRVPRLPHLSDFDLSPLTGVSLPVKIAGQPLWVVVSQDQTGPGAILDDVVDAFLWRYVAFLVVALMLLPLVNSVLIRRLVLAVRRVSERAAGIGPENLDVRLDEADLPAEVSQLVHATNDLIDRLQQSFVAQREFTGNLVHELRTPLAALKVQLDRVRDEGTRKALNRSLDRVSHVISQVRDLAGLETLQAGYRRDFDLRDVAREAVTELAPEIYAAGDTVDLAAPDDGVIVAGEPTLVRLALRNLISNASHHTPPGTAISVAVSVGGAVTVTDTGPGIASDARGLVTQRFWRADQRRADTAGLGLSIVQRIVEVHGGRFELVSDVGTGAQFRIGFPLTERVIPARRAGAPSRDRSGPALH